jgi:tetratricopeptide (TPR) repeat protein
MALLEDKKEAQAEQLLWKIISDSPNYEEAYVALLQRYRDAGSRESISRLIRTWLAADPFNVNARLLQISELMSQRRPNIDLAERSLIGLFREEPDNLAVVSALGQFYQRVGRPEEAVRRLEEECEKRPLNRAATEWLVGYYDAQKQEADAVRVLDRMHGAARDDIDQLYFIAGLYGRIDQKQSSERILEEILRLDPQNIPASNDLGYSWADAGRNLPEAESLIRAAVAAEPENAAYLDSLGWVLYKRAKFDEAQGCLKQATQLLGRPDPVVLDHLGDVLYRLEQTQEAGKIWRQSLDGMPANLAGRDELINLKSHLKAKIQQLEAGQPVNVAPLVAVPTSQAKK